MLMKNKSLVALMIGLAIPTIVYPIIGEIVEVIINFFEIIKGGQIKKITEINIENTKLAEELESNNEYSVSNAIGFEVPNIEEEEYIEE